MIKQLKLPIKRFGTISDRFRYFTFNRYKNAVENVMSIIDKRTTNQEDMCKIEFLLETLQKYQMNPDTLLIGWIAKNISDIKIVHTIDFFDFGIIIARSYDRVLVPDIGREELLYNDMNLSGLCSDRESQLEWMKEYCTFIPLYIIIPDEDQKIRLRVSARSYFLSILIS